MAKEEDIKVTVHYVASPKPFQGDFPPSATVGQVKAAALTGFGLVEGADGAGNTTVYTLFYEKTALENPNQSIGGLVGHQKVLQLKLSQQITQGA